MKNSKYSNIGFNSYLVDNYTFVNFYLDWTKMVKKKSIQGFKIYIDSIFSKL